jgi:hypothetical protein
VTDTATTAPPPGFIVGYRTAYGWAVEFDGPSYDTFEAAAPDCDAAMIQAPELAWTILELSVPGANANPAQTPRMSTQEAVEQAIAQELQRQLGGDNSDKLYLWQSGDDRRTDTAWATIDGGVDCTALAKAVITAIRGGS